MQGHADNTALGLTNPKAASMALETISTYERASGMLLNKHKCVILGSPGWATDLMGFKPAPEGERYLGVGINHIGRVFLLHATWEAVQNRLSTLARIPTSLFGRMTILRAYIHLSLLYQLTVAGFQDMDRWKLLEAHFLNSQGTTLSACSRAIIAASRAHPLNWGRLPLIEWEIDLGRATAGPLCLQSL